MPNLHRARVVAIGTEADMLRLNRALLNNMDALEDIEDGPAPTLEDIYQQVRKTAQYEGAQDSTFLYDMIVPSPYGDAEDESCRYTLRKEACGL